MFKQLTFSSVWFNINDGLIDSHVDSLTCHEALILGVGQVHVGVRQED